MPVSPIGTVSGAKPTLLARGVKYRVFGPSGGGALNPTYQALGVSALKLTPRLTSESVSYVSRLIGPGDVLIVDGDQYASLISVAPQIPAGPSGALTTFSYLSTPANLYIEPIAPGEFVTEITHMHRSAALLSMITTTTPTGGWNQTDTWTVPNGQRWRVRAAYVFEYISTSTGSNVGVVFTRSPFTIAEIATTLSSTGTQSTAGNYVAQSDETGNYNATGGNSVLMRPGGVVLHPGDILAVYVDSPNAGDTVIVSVIMEVEADG